MAFHKIIWKILQLSSLLNPPCSFILFTFYWLCSSWELYPNKKQSRGIFQRSYAVCKKRWVCTSLDSTQFCFVLFHPNKQAGAKATNKGDSVGSTPSAETE